MEKPDKTVKQEWTATLTSSPVTPEEPEDHGRVFFNIPFCARSRFAINAFPEREPTITIYDDIWSNEQRRWIQHCAPNSIALSTLRRLMELVEEELAK